MPADAPLLLASLRHGHAVVAGEHVIEPVNYNAPVIASALGRDVFPRERAEGGADAALSFKTFPMNSRMPSDSDV